MDSVSGAVFLKIPESLPFKRDFSLCQNPVSIGTEITLQSPDLHPSFTLCQNLIFLA
jgi:hypothetical protein